MNDTEASRLGSLQCGTRQEFCNQSPGLLCRKEIGSYKVNKLRALYNKEEEVNTSESTGEKNYFRVDREKTS
jgi:hypothetical protein